MNNPIRNNRKPAEVLESGRVYAQGNLKALSAHFHATMSPSKEDGRVSAVLGAN